MTLPVSLQRLYNARPSHILPFCERVKLLFHDSEFQNEIIQTSDFFSFPPWDIPKFSFLNPFSGYDKSTTAPVVFQTLFHSHRCQYSVYIPVFTDGSKSDSHVGCGVLFHTDTLSYRLHTSFSVLSAELVAILYALQTISLFTERRFCIYTDSMSSLETLSNFHNRMHPVAMEILALLNILQNRDFDILFCWIPGHVGIVGNNLADNAAKTASSFLQREIPFCDAKKSFARRLQSLWQESWDRQTNNKLHILKPAISFWPCMPVRELDVKVTRLCIGHTRFTHRHLLFGERAPTCSRCQVNLTVVHVLTL
ncbi:hypothetical protein AVEN_41253-1 [Araneus ventricosus]|uniref:ribonuclease H n=1 Tax=Araneus ventricosus TaxID=182803 RepID=A0A4Y2KYU1_ARAVE|nr:hypothetical protein AVEN_41253-1 [Araneus ventricosus]